MENNKEQIERKMYTEDDVMRTIVKMKDNSKKALLKINFDNIHGLANDLEYRKSVVEYFDKAIEQLKQEKEAVNEFVSLIENKGDTTEETINDMISNYKRFSRSDRLEFNKKLQGENNLPESLEMFEYTWNKFVDKLRGAM